MKTLPKTLLLFFILIVPLKGISQNISGYVFDAEDSTALANVSVYFDGTSIGGITNEQGFFEIEKQKSISAPLVISFIGYENVLLTGAKNKLPNIYLKPKMESLEAVVITNDPWSRKKKMRIFRREFLGLSNEAKKCEIKNEDDIKLRYNPISKTLTAKAEAPIILENNHLGYKINYNLVKFKLEFPKEDTPNNIGTTLLYAGTSFYQELKDKVKRRYRKAREEAYYGSPLHFMRSLSAKKLVENDFQIIHQKLAVPPYQFFQFEKHPDATKVSMTIPKLIIVHGDLIQSSIMAEAPFYIDSFGNHTPINAVTFGGNMSTKRLTHTLPLDYRPKK